MPLVVLQPPVALAQQVVVVQAGETLSEIAERHGVSLTRLMQANGISNPDHVEVGQRLTLPGSASRGSSASSQRGGTVTVRAGETLSEIAERHGVSLTRLMQANGLSNPDHVEVGQRLTLPGGAARAAASPARNSQPTAPYTVKSGETLSDIAARFNTTTDRLIQLNGLRNPDLVMSGTRLQVPAQARAAAPAKPAAAPVNRQAAEHVVSRGESLSLIAERYGTSVDRLVALNQLEDPERLLVGTRLKLRGTPPAPQQARRPAAPATTPTAPAPAPVAAAPKPTQPAATAAPRPAATPATAPATAPAPAPATGSATASATASAATPAAAPATAAIATPRPAVSTATPASGTLNTAAAPRPSASTANASTSTASSSATSRSTASPASSSGTPASSTPSPSRISQATTAASQSPSRTAATTTTAATTAATATATGTASSASTATGTASRATTATTSSRLGRPASPVSTNPGSRATATATPASAASSAASSTTAARKPTSGDWRNYGPLQVDWSKLQPMGGSYVAPSLNGEGQPLYLAVNCTARKINVTSQAGQWKTWETPSKDFEQKLVQDICKARAS